MTICAAPDSRLLLDFQEFYRELHRLRGQAARESNSGPLVRLLERQSSHARSLLDPIGFEVYREAQYVMAALADDLFRNSEGELPPSWQSLEYRFFRASSAGKLFFQKLEWLLQGEGREHVELAQIYFFAICLGFQGKYRTAGDKTSLTAYRQQLFTKIFNAPPVSARQDTRLVALAPPRSVPEEEMRSLPPPPIWMALPAGVLLLWVLFSFVFWTGFIRPMTQMMNTSTPSHAVGER